MMHSMLVLACLGILLHFIGHSQATEWKCWNSSQYKLFWNGTKVIHENAKKICEAHNANLTSICSLEEEDKLFNWFYDKIRNYKVWIGYECKAPLHQCRDYKKNWNGVDGRHCSYTNWKNSQPGRGHNRARLDHDRSNSTWWVGITHGYALDGLICRRDAIRPCETTTTAVPEAVTTSSTQADCKNQKSCDLLAKSAYTNRLQNILLSNESNDKALQEVHELIQDSPSSLEAQDVRYLSDILDKAPEKDSEYILKLVDITLETNKSVLQNAQQEWNASSRILKKLANYAENIKLDATGKSISVESNIALAVWDATANATLPFAFGVEQDSDVGLSKNNVKSHFQPDSYTTYSNNSAAIVLNSQLIQRTRHAKINDSKAVRLSFTIFRKGELFLSPPPGSGSAGKPVSISNSIIVAGTIHNVNTSDLSDPIVLIFKPIKNISEHTPTCAFWDFSLNGGNGKWSSEGCSFNGTLEDKVICQCWHLTHFAILGSIDQSEIERSHARALHIITITGTTLSITGLAFTIITFLAFRQFRKARSQKVLFNLALSLLAVNVIFLGGINATPKHGHNAIVCKFVAALLQYFLLVSFAWMLVEAIMQYLQLVKVFDSYVPRFMLKTCVPAWVLPSVPVIVVASLDHELLNDHPVKHCWLGQTAFYYAFLLPVGTVIIINTVLFIIVIKSITCDRPKLQCSMPDIELKKLQVNSGITCFILMGLAWIFGFMAISHARLAFQYLFCIFNAFQGFFIFVFCIMQSPAIRNAWRQLFVSKAAQVRLISASSSHKVTESTRL